MTQGQGQRPGPPTDRERRRPPRIGTLLLWMVLLGLPFVITSQLLQAGLDLATPGEQPGGEIAGLARAQESGTALRNVPVALHLAHDETSPTTEIASTRTDDEGRFRFDAPPCQGYYRVHVGGGELRRVVRNFSFLDQDEPLEVDLGPGAALEVRLEHAAGERVRGGTLYLEARLGGGGLRFFSPMLRLEDHFEGPSVRIDGLPPLTGKARVELDGGERLEFEFELEEGQTRQFAYTL